MQRVRRRQQYRLHLRIGDGVLQVGRQPEAMHGRQVAREAELLADAVHDADARAFALNRTENRLAPAAQPNHGGIDHFYARASSYLANVGQSI